MTNPIEKEQEQEHQSTEGPTYAQLLGLLNAARYMGYEKDLNNLLDYLAKQCASAIGVDRCSIFLLDEAKGEIWSKLALGEENEIRFPIKTGIAGHVIDTGEPVIIDDAYTSDLFNPSIDAATGYKTKNILCIPMTNSEGIVTGCFQLINKTAGAFNDGDANFLTAFGAQSAAAIESALLFREKESIISDLTKTKLDLKQKVEQLEVINSLEQELSAARKLEIFLDSAVNHTARVMWARAGVIMVSKVGMQMVHSAVVNDTGKWVSDRFEARDDKLKTLFKDEKSSIINSVQDFWSLDDRLGIKTNNIAFAPIVAPNQDKALGIIAMMNRGSGEFSHADGAFLEIMARQIGSMMARLQSVEEKEQSNRLASIGKLASTIIHDFKNPLASIRGFAELMTRINPQEAPEKVTKFSEIIMTQVDRCTAMAGELLSFARGESNLSMEKLSVSELLDEVATIVEASAESKGIKFIYKNEIHAFATMDKNRFMRALFNLTNNAIEVLKAEDTLELICTEVDDSIDIRVGDSGPGIPDDLKETMFDPFVTHGKANGTGLGLHITKTIIEKHAGVIQLDPSREQGTMFVIRIPIFAAEKSA